MEDQISCFVAAVMKQKIACQHQLFWDNKKTLIDTSPTKQDKKKLLPIFYFLL